MTTPFGAARAVTKIEVEDLDQAIADLRKRGLEFATFDMPGFEVSDEIVATLPRPRRCVQPEARPDACGGAAVRAGVRRAGHARGAAADRRRAGRRASDRQPPWKSCAGNYRRREGCGIMVSRSPTSRARPRPWYRWSRREL